MQLKSLLPRLTPKQLLTARTPLLQRLMVDLIYPAVLGSVMYIVLQVCVTPVIGGLATARGDTVNPFTPNRLPAALKIWYLAVTVVFYLCDYLYARFTRAFRFMFFLFNTIFLLGLYVTVVCINPFSGEAVVHEYLARAYGAFMVLYLIWDIYESKQNDLRAGEASFYTFVIRWEQLSLMLLGGHILASVVGWPPWLASPVALVGILSFITIGFVVVVRRKRTFSDEPAA
jgi:hypothetical protein